MLWLVHKTKVTTFVVNPKFIFTFAFMEKEKKKIGVVTPTLKLLRHWVKNVGAEYYGDADFYLLKSVEDTHGVVFHAVEKGPFSHEVDCEVYGAAFMRIKSLIP